MADGALLPGWLLWSLPAMFLLHDAEEVLFLSVALHFVW